jgi:hypothetical protein
MAESQPDKIGWFIRLKAAFCRICPLCCLARRRPDSALARRIRVVQAHCPFCHAHVKVQRARASAGKT